MSSIPLNVRTTSTTRLTLPLLIQRMRIPRRPAFLITHNIRPSLSPLLLRAAAYPDLTPGGNGMDDTAAIFPVIPDHPDLPAGVDESDVPGDSADNPDLPAWVDESDVFSGPDVQKKRLDVSSCPDVKKKRFLVLERGPDGKFGLNPTESTEERRIRIEEYKQQYEKFLSTYVKDDDLKARLLDRMAKNENLAKYGNPYQGALDEIRLLSAKLDLFLARKVVDGSKKRDESKKREPSLSLDCVDGSVKIKSFVDGSVKRKPSLDSERKPSVDGSVKRKPSLDSAVDVKTLVINLRLFFLILNFVRKKNP